MFCSSIYPNKKWFLHFPTKKKIKRVAQHWRNKLCSLDKFSEFHPFCYCKSWCNNRCVMDIRGSTVSPTEIPGMSVSRVANAQKWIPKTKPHSIIQWMGIRFGGTETVTTSCSKSIKAYRSVCSTWPVERTQGAIMDSMYQLVRGGILLAKVEKTERSWVPQSIDFLYIPVLTSASSWKLWNHSLISIVWIKSQQEWLFGETVQACLACLWWYNKWHCFSLNLYVWTLSCF